MSLTKQAKTLTKHQQSAMMLFLQSTRHSQRNQLIFMLSIKAGLRAKEIASLTWSMITDAEGNITDAIRLNNHAAKGRSGGVIYLNKDLKQMLIHYRQTCKFAHLDETVIKTERNNQTDAQVIVNMFSAWYRKLGFHGCSSHSGRRTFITNAARKISSVGGSMRDVQMLARHSSLQMTQRYIDCDTDAQKKIVHLV
ncbi:MAG: integrase [Alphaproteobacteria bacterium]|nr:integrase [Alphaproteobacteria bacterium]HCQ71627.1 site-specific integrase [Rhodospirillaceae bacterium]|tara:strand:+ start:146 stop:733 length:588 start_codon:yes stop_codon:yes gene_type:complete